MRECFRLAAKGKGFVSPNPLVGAVLVTEERIVGRGYHRRFGGPHAEVNCFRSYKGSLSKATLYVNLEPCAHYGKTHPCVDLILQRGIKRVVVAMKDPNPVVSGKGIAKLRRAGVAVKLGVLEEEAKHQNRFFVEHIQSRLPYVHVKIAQTRDGFISTGSGRYITSKPSRILVHRWRTEYDAILVGAGTILADNPRLNIRLANGRNPAVVILDGKLRLTGKEKIFSSARERGVFLCIGKSAGERQMSKVRMLANRGVRIFPFRLQNGRIALNDVLQELYAHDIGSLFVEGGSQIFSQFIEQNSLDELSIFTAPKECGSGVQGLSRKASIIVGQIIADNQFVSKRIGSDFLTTGIIERN